MLSQEDATAIDEMFMLRRRYPELDMPERLIEQFTSLPRGPEKCVFAQTTRTISADLVTKITPCQLGGAPDCESRGCVAAMGLDAVAAHRWAGLMPVDAVFRASLKIGRSVPGSHQAPRANSLLRVLPRPIAAGSLFDAKTEKHSSKESSSCKESNSWQEPNS
jgi:hypothetical protein